MKQAFILTFAFLLGACVGPSRVVTVEAPTLSSVDQAASLTSKTVALVRVTSDGVKAYCSAVWVAPTKILTAQHCVDEGAIGDAILYATKADTFGPGDRAQEFFVPRLATLAKVDAAHDLALLQVTSAPAHESAAISTERIFAGLSVQTMGHPRGLWWSYSRGNVSAVRQEDFGLDILWIQSSAPISPGNSGGGLFDDEGNLLGICSRGLMDSKSQNLNFYVHRVYIMDFLQ